MAIKGVSRPIRLGIAEARTHQAANGGVDIPQDRSANHNPRHKQPAGPAVPQQGTAYGMRPPPYFHLPVTANFRAVKAGNHLVEHQVNQLVFALDMVVKGHRGHTERSG